HRPEVPGGGRAEELANEPQGLPDVVLLAGGPAVLDVVGLDVPEVAEDQLVDRQPPIGRTGSVGRWEMVGVGPPLGDQAGILLVAFRRTVGPEVMVFAVDGDDGAVARLLETIGRRSVGTGHGAALEGRQNSTCTVLRGASLPRFRPPEGT